MQTHKSHKAQRADRILALGNALGVHVRTFGRLKVCCINFQIDPSYAADLQPAIPFHYYSQGVALG